MRKKLLTALCLITLSACTSPYGNYAKVADSYNAQMADDSAKELVALYPPATTHIRLSQEINDAYGEDLVIKLRESRYAIEEGKDTQRTTNAASSSPTPNDSNDAVPATTLPLYYTVDNIGSVLYRVTINAGDQKINRVYKISGVHMLPVGAWTRKE